MTFAGYEWHGDRRIFGDHNVFYFDEGPLDAAETLPDLFANLRRNKGIAIPHHTGYQVGQRGKHWDYYDEELSPFVEIFSDHGSSEGCNTAFTMDRVASMGPRVSGGTVQDGLARGYRVGIIASGDNHSGFPGVWGNGLVGVWAAELTREGLWQAFRSRRVYGVTGDRISLAFEVNGLGMGSVGKTEGIADIRAHIVGCHAIDRVELLRNERVLYTYCHSGTWDVPGGGGQIRLKMRIDCGWGLSEFYGLKTANKIWRGQLRIDRGRLVNVQVADIARGEFGLKLLFEPHTASHVEYVDQIETPLHHTDFDRVSLCLDIGHCSYRGGEPVSLVREHRHRICYLHLKNVDPEVKRKVEAEGIPFQRAVGMGVFCELSRGSVDVVALRDLLREIDYDGWVIVEQGMYPAPFDRPLPIAKRNLAYLRKLGFE